MKAIQISRTSRVTCTLPVDTLSALDYIAERIGCTRSAVVAHLLSDSCKDMVEVVESSLPASGGSTPPARRASGRSAEELGAIFDSLEENLKRRDIANWLAEGDNFRLHQEKDG